LNSQHIEAVNSFINDHIPLEFSTIEPANSFLKAQFFVFDRLVRELK